MTRNVHQRLAFAMGKVSYIQNEQKKGMQYRVVSHDKVTAKVRPALLEAGIVYYPVRCEYRQDGNRTECSLTVRFVNVDEPGDFFDVPSLGFGVDPSDKGPGKAMSYAVKYALLKAMGLETGEDPDEDADTPPHSRANPHAPEPVRDPVAITAALIGGINGCATVQEVINAQNGAKFKEAAAWLRANHAGHAATLQEAIDRRTRELSQAAA